MALDVGDLIYVLRRMLDEVNNAAVADGSPEDYKLPERQYVTTGGAVYDCEQVTVSASSLTVGIAGADGGGTIDGCLPGWNAVIEVAIVRNAREVATGRDGLGAPLVEDIEADTAVASADLAIITRAVAAIAGPNWDQYGRVPASIQIGEVQGKLFAVVLTATLNVWAFEPPASP